MKVLHLSTSDGNGGAARGAYWLHQALRQAGVDSWMLVAEKVTNDATVLGPKGITGKQKIINGLRQTIEYWPLRRYPQKTSGLFSPAIFPSSIVKQVRAINPDIVNLHWVGMGFLKPEHLQHFTQPIVWTLRDMWAFTGGCSYAGNCDRYQQQCGSCPALGSHRNYDLSRKVWNRKERAWRKLDLTLVPISHWLAECAQRSSLFQHYPIKVIPNAVDIYRYRPINKAIARQILQLPINKKVILFGALNPTTDKRKGFEHLVKALRHLAAQSQDTSQLIAVVFGAEAPAKSLDLGMTTTFLGRFYDDTMLALTYSAADVMVVPSIEEAFGKTAIEAMACGTPVVSFDTTGLKDSVVHQKNGYRAHCFSNEDLARGIQWVIEDPQRWEYLSCQARATVETGFTFAYQAEQYQQLYKQLLL